MSYKSICVCLDNSDASKDRLNFALDFATRQQAHLTGLYISYCPAVIVDPYGTWAPLLLECEETAKTQEKSAEASFNAAASNAGVPFNWISHRSDNFEAILAHARNNDLCIVGQRNPGDINTDLGNDFYELFVLKLGRPVLFLPFENRYPTQFATVMVAWNGSREAMRALTDALPLLKLAKQVFVLTINELRDVGKDLPDIDIAAFLTRHNVNVTVETRDSGEEKASDWLFSCTAEAGADLVVMGAYGHSRFNEIILGGMTREVMRKMSVPVLMSH